MKQKEKKSTCEHYEQEKSSRHQEVQDYQQKNDIFTFNSLPLMATNCMLWVTGQPLTFFNFLL